MNDYPDRPLPLLDLNRGTHGAAGALERFTRLLSSAGALATAGATLVEPLRALAGWLGGLGKPVLQLLS